MEEAADVLEAEAWRRAVKGVDKPMTVATMREVVKEYSDTLLIFLLKGSKPTKFRDNSFVEHQGHVEVNHKTTIDHDAFTKDFADFARRHGMGNTPANGN